MKYIDNFLNGITMYKLVLYGLQILAGLSILLGFFGKLPFSGLSLVYSFLTLTITCWGTNTIFEKIFKVQTNVESYSITAFILFFITFPIESISDFKLLVIAGFIAMASKYLFAINKKHIFNPAGIALVFLSIAGYGISAWWVGSTILFIPTFILGFLVLRKVRRFSMFFAFLAASFVSISLFGVLNGTSLWGSVSTIFTSWPVLFLGSIMLTEPLTTPPTMKLQLVYGVLVGLFFGSQFHIGSLYSTPELALIIGNVFSYIVSPKVRLVLTLKQKDQLTADVYNFVFSKNDKFSFKPGQYLEWTLGHAKPDIRGNRRYFTIGSSPTEEDLILGTKFYPNPSTFKQKLLAMSPGDKMIASELRGEFTMPEDINKKLVFIAGGIGVTPFRSMAKYMIDTNETRDIYFFYSNKTLADTAYKDVFDFAEKDNGWKNIYVVNEQGNDVLLPNMKVGFITKEMIVEQVPDYKERIFMISGTHGMVTVFEKTLKDLGVPNNQIKTDFFPGFV